MSWRLYADVGNSTIKFAARQGGAWACVVRVDWDEACANEMLEPANFAVGRLMNDLGKVSLDAEDCDGLVGCGSAEDADMIFMALGSAFDKNVRLLGRDLKAKMKSRYQPPGSLGADRAANAMAAYALYGGPVIVVDSGSCLTTEIVSADGTFLGGHIAAGMPALMEGILELAPQLEPALETAIPPDNDLIGRSTGQCLLLGTAIQITVTINAFIDAGRDYLEAPDATAIITGGACEAIAEGYDDEHVLANPMLTLEGLRLIDGYE